MLKTTYDGESLLHRHLWQIVKRQMEMSAKVKVGAFHTDLVAMVFAFHTIEAYINYLGEYLAPDVWADERNFFRNEPYRGFNGKIKKILELVGMDWDQRTHYPLKSVVDLKYLRDLIAHAKPEKISDEIAHDDGTEPPIFVPELHKLVTQDTCKLHISSVEELLEQIHQRAIHLIKNPKFDRHALFGVTTYVTRHTSKKQ